MSYCSRIAPPVDLVVRPVGYRQHLTTGVVSQWSAYDASPQELLRRSYSSVKTSNFKRLRKRDQPVNGFLAHTAILTDSIGSVSGKPNSAFPYKATGYGRKTMGTSYQAALSVFNQYWNSSTTVRTQAEQRALDSLSNMKINLAQAFAERKQTAGLLVNSVHRFVQFASAFKRGKWSICNKLLLRSGHPKLRPMSLARQKKELFGKPVRDWKASDLIHQPGTSFSNLWLEYSYGWRPLLSDIYGAAELLAQLHTDTRPERAIGTAVQHYTFKSTYPAEGLLGTAHGEATVKAKCVLYFEVEDRFRDSLKSTGITNPALLAWELLPYSFVVDWFIPVGNYLSNLMATSGLRFIKGSTTSVSTFEAFSTSVSDNVTWILHDAFPVSIKAAEINRTKLNSFPTATFIPSFNYSLNASQGLSAVALLAQFFQPTKRVR